MPWIRVWLVALVMLMLTSPCRPAVSDAVSSSDVELSTALARHAQNVTLEFWARCARCVIAAAGLICRSSERARAGGQNVHDSTPSQHHRR
jgi:hypothetical protein